jgi:hypothetical protein
LIPPPTLIDRTNLLFGGHIFHYLSASLRQPLSAAPSPRQIGEVDSALARFETGLKAFAIGLVEMDSALAPKAIEPFYANPSVTNEVCHSGLLLSAQMPDSL